MNQPQPKPFFISKHVVMEAWGRVKANRGAAGIDEESIKDFEGNLKDNLYRIWNRISSGSYLPPPVMVQSPKAAERVQASVIRFVEGKLKLVVNRNKSRCAPLKQCIFLGFQIGARGKAVWTEKAQARFKQRVREITSRCRGHRVQTVITELRRYVVGWLNYFGISHIYRVLLELEEWVRRRLLLYYWKQWKQPRTRRKHLLALGIEPERVKLATHSRKGYWRMSANSIVQRALTNRWLQEQGVPDMKAQWIALYYPPPKGGV